MFTRHQLYQLYEEGRAPTVRLIESVLDYSEELKHDPHTRQQRHIADLAERIAKLQARLRRVEEKLERQQCLNYALRRRIAELEAAFGRTDRFQQRTLLRDGRLFLRRIVADEIPRHYLRGRCAAT